MEKNYKDVFYEKYTSTHIIGRKGEIALDKLDYQAEMYDELYGKFLPAGKDANIIDVGCGYGSLVFWLQKKSFINSFGIDVSKEQIELGNKLDIKNLYQEDLLKYLGENKDKYDLIIMRDVLEHFSKKEILEILEFCHSSLAGTGKILIQVPNAESPFFGRIRYGDFTHDLAFTGSSLNQILSISGYKEVSFHSVQPVGITGFSFKKIIRKLSWKVTEALYHFFLFAEVGRCPKVVTQNILVVASK